MSLDILKTKEIRGQVLKLLNQERMRELSETTVVRALIGMGYYIEEKELHGEIKYLQDKGYVAYRTIKPKTIFSKLVIRMVKITSKGKDLLEGTPPEGDPGVAIDWE